MSRVFLVLTVVLFSLYIGGAIPVRVGKTGPSQQPTQRFDNGQIKKPFPEVVSLELPPPELPSPKEPSLEAPLPETVFSDSFSDSFSDFLTLDEESGPNFCPIVHDDEMGNCDKVERIAEILGMPKNTELCEDALAWLEQLSHCCESAVSEPSAMCSRNAVRIMSSGSKVIRHGDLQ
jgi:hypothetical protein